MHDAPSVMDAFHANPIFFSLAIMLGTAGLVLLVVALIVVRPKPGIAMGIAVAAAVAGLLAIGAGSLARAQDRQRTDSAAGVRGLTDSERARVRALGYGEARLSVIVGVAAGGLPLAGGALLAIITMITTRKKKAV